MIDLKGIWSGVYLSGSG